MVQSSEHVWKGNPCVVIVIVTDNGHEIPNKRVANVSRGMPLRSNRTVVRLTNGTMIRLRMKEAMRENDLPMAQQVLRLAGDEASTMINAPAGGYTLMHDASEKNDPAWLMLLIDHGGNVNARNPRRQTPLHLAVNAANEANVMVLLKAGADVNAMDEYDETPLMWAVEAIEPSLPLVDCLLSAGAVCDVQDRHGRTVWNRVEPNTLVFERLWNSRLNAETDDLNSCLRIPSLSA